MIFRHPSFAGRIGFARRDITPPIGIRHRNWGAQTHEVAEGIHRPLTATVLTLQTDVDNPPVVIAGLDLGWWRTPEDEWFVRGSILRDLGLGEERLLLCLSHTHAGPTTHLGDAELPGGHFIEPYLKHVAESVTLAVEEALSTAGSAVLEMTSGSSPLPQYRDVKDPEQDRFLVGFQPDDSIVFDTLKVARITSVNGKSLGTILLCACHPTSLGWENQLISPDYVGAARETVERETGVPCLFLQGWSGDLAPRDQYSGDPAVADRNGRQVGLSTLAQLESMLPPATALVHAGVVESGAPLQKLGSISVAPPRQLIARRLFADVKPKPLPSLAEIDASIAAATEPYERERWLRKRQVRESVPDGFKLPLYYVRAGEVMFAGVPGEMNSYFAFAFDEEIIMFPEADPPRGCFPINVVNGWYGYLPEKWLYGREQYSVVQSPFSPPVAEAVLDRFTREMRGDPT